MTITAMSFRVLACKVQTGGHIIPPFDIDHTFDSADEARRIYDSLVGYPVKDLHIQTVYNDSLMLSTSLVSADQSTWYEKAVAGNLKYWKKRVPQ